MDDRQFIVELIQHGAWPIVALLIAWLAKDKISDIFGGGLKSAKHGDTEFQFFEKNQSLQPVKLEHQNLQHLIPIDPTGLRDEVEVRINGQLTQIVGDSEKINVLVKNLAQQQISNAFERIYFHIYGSQIQMLEFLSVQPAGTATNHELSKIYEKAKAENQNAYQNYSFSEYMNFLLSWSLATNRNDSWEISKNGRAFITYITALRLEKNKAL